MDDVILVLKNEAKAFRIKYKEAYGEDKSHTKCLEYISRLYGFKDWNTLRAIAESDPSRIRQLLLVKGIFPSK